MAKKAAGERNVPAIATPKRKRTAKAVRLDLTAKDHERLDRAATSKGLSKSAFARMAVLDRLKELEEGSK
jgi:hypothetical protein